MNVDEYFGKWSKVIDTKEADRVVRKLLPIKNNICPQLKDLFRAFLLCPYDDLRVVIIGQDPYFNLRNGSVVATGLAFANSSNTPENSYSPSLEILRESVIDFSKSHGIINFDPSLERWAEQGVLLLNASLSCLKGRPGSHNLLWMPFISSLLTHLSEQKTGVVYVLMGSSAQALSSCINSKNNYILKIKHPSWYARVKEPMPSELWREIDNILIGQNGYGIEWFKEDN